MTGHALVFSNGEVICGKHAVLDDYVFNFLIDDEICQVKIIKEQEGRFKYTMQIDTETATELNKKRNKHYRNERLKIIILVGTSILIFISCIIAGQVFDAFNPIDPINVVEDGRFEVAEMHYSQTSQPEFRYLFRRIEYDQRSQLNRRLGASWLASTGLPIEAQDSFFVSFVKFTPYYGRIHYDRPSRTQMRRYQKRLRPKIPLSHIGPYRPAAYCDCVTYKLFKWRGYSAWADLYFKDTPLHINPLNNEVTFNTMQQSPIYKHILQRCATKHLYTD